MIRLAVLVIVSFQAAAFAAPAACDFSSGRVVLAQSKNELTVRWDLPKSAALEAPFIPAGKAESDYVTWVKDHHPPSPEAALRKSIELRESFLREHGDIAGAESFKREISNVRKILAGTGRLRAMSCLESLPFREQLGFADLRGRAFEFMASVYEKDGRYRLVANFNRQSNGGAGPSKAATKEGQTLTKAGWSLAIHLHNHPFSFENPYGDFGGTLVPSLPDVAMYQYLRPRVALITNGLQTIELRKNEYLGLERY